MHGQGKNKTGRNGKNLIIHVPCGTLVRDRETEEIIGDLVQDGQRLVTAKGGRAGLGNTSFATSTDKAPRKATPGEPGEAKWLYLELKLLADVGIIGLPNAGKSSFLAHISAANPKIAAYPFTTLIPHLGTITLDNGESLVIADIPGLIEGAHQGLGLGDQFLRHVERSKILLHVIDIATPYHGDPVRDYEVIDTELRECRRGLEGKLRLIAMNKIDCPHTEQNQKSLQSFLKGLKIPVFSISALTGEGIENLLGYIVNISGEKQDRP
jgi:GTP-binding protein